MQRIVCHRLRRVCQCNKHTFCERQLVVYAVFFSFKVSGICMAFNIIASSFILASQWDAYYLCLICNKNLPSDSTNAWTKDSGVWHGLFYIAFITSKGRIKLIKPQRRLTRKQICMHSAWTKWDVMLGAGLLPVGCDYRAIAVLRLLWSGLSAMSCLPLMEGSTVWYTYV